MPAAEVSISCHLIWGWAWAGDDDLAAGKRFPGAAPGAPPPQGNASSSNPSSRGPSPAGTRSVQRPQERPGSRCSHSCSVGTAQNHNVVRRLIQAYQQEALPCL